MSRTKKDILETEHMLTRLTNLFVEHRNPSAFAGVYKHIAQHDAESLRRISMTLHRWHESVCNGDIEQGEVSGKWYQSWSDDRGHRRQSDTPIPDREAGAKKRLAQILKRYPSLTGYVQTDPRGCALYILKPGDVSEGADPSSCYSRGLAVYR